MAQVVLLRGVNVGGHRTFKPKALADALRHLGVVNIGAAGTFIVREPVGRDALEAEIARRLPFDADIMICQGRDVARVLAHEAFTGATEPGEVRFVSVMARVPRPAPALPVQFPAEGDWLLRVFAREGRFLFGSYRRHMQAVRYLGTLDRVFGVPITTRNWNTFTAIGKALRGD